MLDHLCLLLSHRTYKFALGTAKLSMHRAIAPSFVLRHVTLRELAQEQRHCAGILGVDRPRSRHSITIALDGFSRELASHRELRVEAGQMLYVPEGATCAGRASGAFLEIEWEPGAFGSHARSETTVISLLPRSLRVARELADTLSVAANDAEITVPLASLLDALRSEGLDLRTESLETIPTSVEEQALFSCIDNHLSSLADAPMLVDFERSVNASRRTMTRRVSALCERYRLTDGESWRKMRDESRLVVASILLTHDDASPRAVASFVGYGSVEALDHAFHNAGFESPVAFQRTLRAA